ncbi:MAG: potassium/proton antiporter [Candidatus Omnitrophica bacterium]|jgi:cell volume regulation protein A|nr:potassium/proton antiporter [Candidatus Omnitrophota bacterium]
MSIEFFILWGAVLILLSVISSKVSDRIAVPALLLFLAIGILAGSEGLGIIYFDNYKITKSIGVIALVLILFSGGLGASWKSVKPLFPAGFMLSTFGVLITALVVGACSVFILNFSVWEGLLLGAIVSSTDAAAVLSILKSKKISLKGKLKPLLELESGSNDPMAVFLTIGFLGILTNSLSSPWSLFPLFILNMGLGLLAGYLMAKVSILVIDRIKLGYEGLYPVLTVSLVFLTYSLASLIKGNGFLAVYILGLLMSRGEFAYKKSLVKFYEGTAWLMQIAMFITLGLLVFPSQIPPVAGKGILVAAVLIFLARPAGVFLSLIPFKFSLSEKLMISWVGLRGAVPVILATFPLLAGIPQAHMIFNIVFFIVLLSVLAQGTTIHLVSRVLNVNAPFDFRKPYPIEFERAEGFESSLTDMIVPYHSEIIGKSIAEIKIPPEALVVLISRGEKFIVPNGSTVLESGDVLLVLANEEDLKIINGILAGGIR